MAKCIYPTIFINRKLLKVNMFKINETQESSTTISYGQVIVITPRLLQLTWAEVDAVCKDKYCWMPYGIKGHGWILI